ncbi:translocon-associated protein subunit beta [Angomonas deanei]|uniref:Translocon-associated protein beta (TRAPB), putative n=1 Tax=Angomonas deanei TaxID=59799 RepID=A0A7G2CGX6_9TRYP|nr:translocon-associated protein subunit beta [Angomonas deanei]CAD2217943.1 Translocon-associated protein beta (TRAPB), putative [Angomonas deanei]|eukprot:EPY40607.1 translocon-associated protein subunit beta [Angomonas deanei]
MRVRVRHPFFVCLSGKTSAHLLLLSFTFDFARKEYILSMNKRSIFSLVIALALTVTLAQSSVETITDPFLIVSKHTSSDDIVLGTSFDVVVEVTNQGQSPAYEVEVVDVLEDGTKKTIRAEVLPFGKPVVLRYTVTPKVLGNYLVGVTRVTYNTVQGDSSSQRVAMSNFIREGEAHFLSEGVDDESFRGVVSVLTRERYDRLHAKYVKEIISYIFLGLVPAFFPYALYSMNVRAEADVLVRKTKKTK